MAVVVGDSLENAPFGDFSLGVEIRDISTVVVQRIHGLPDFPSISRNPHCPLAILPLYCQLLQDGFLLAYYKSAGISESC